MGVTDSVRESWATRAGFILAAVGSAVGLGNIWRFPFQVGQEGGAAFLLVYLLFVLLIGVPAMLVEFVIGRRTASNTVGALREIGGGYWRYVGGLFVLIGFVILSYYSVVAGWALRYFVGSFTGAYMDAPSEYFGDIAIGMDAALFHAIMMAAVIAIVAFGIRRGIELAVKVMVPAIVVLIVGLAIYAATLPGIEGAYSYYLSPDFDVIADNWQSILPAAAGQALFTLSIGMGVMITYASYLAEDRNLGEDSAVIISIDTLVAVVTGLVVFPILFAAGFTATEIADPDLIGAGAVFIALAGAFADVTLGRVLGVFFFGVLTIAALSSMISLLEVVVAYAIDEHGADRRNATLAIGGGIFLLGLPVALIDLVFVDLYDLLAAQVLLVLGATLLAILASWIVSDQAVNELGKGVGNLGSWGDAWIWLVRVPVLIVLLVTLYLAVTGYVDFLQTDFAGFLEG